VFGNNHLRLSLVLLSRIAATEKIREIVFVVGK